MSSGIVLVVDDEPGLREVLCTDLNFEGFKTLSAGSGNEALKILSSNKVEVVLSDVRMADGDGVYLTKEIRKRYPRIPIVALMTGFSDFTEKEATNIGARIILPKPYKLDMLIGVINNLMNEAQKP